MQSWGTRSRWDVRETGAEPTKSGVIGLLGCALGLRRDSDDLLFLDSKLLFGVRVEREGVVSTDYHTVTGYHRTAAGEFKHSGGTAKSFEKALEHGECTVVSPREYLHDAAFLVALSSDEQGLLQRIVGIDASGPWKGSLVNPCWPLYLGRKSCVPSRPVFERLTDEYQDVEDALKKEPWSGLRSRKTEKQKAPPKLLAWIEHPDGEYERQDALRVNQLRFYEYRRCQHIEIETTTMVHAPERRNP
ncbi:MAG: type I-E CRISPR-associated protein Cas5/CasD [Bacteroidia bacterium]|nr:type I-E CRISPR-associated protein Cas5/CasD [Bacteroidia bacterium]